ncbi:MAG: alpha/beta hydrolase [Solirubrobacterales bacterium]|nr:alpha/beta hydrolase [Solirubrobacterales bacterium]
MSTDGRGRRPIVLVPGACLGGWAWREVAAALREAGHEVHPLTLTGLGERVHLARPEVDLDTHIEDVVNVLDFNALEDAVLVGHSYAGVVVAGAADRRAQRLHTVVYLDTAPLPDGTAIADVQSPEQREAGERAVRERGDGWRWPVPDRDTLQAGAFGSASDLNEEHLQLIEELATPQPYATMTAPVRLAHPRPPGVRRAAILCAAGGMGVAQLRTLVAERDPRAAPFADADAGWELHELPTGHWPMLSAPGALAELLHRIALG